MTTDEMRQRAIAQMQGVAALNLAYVGVVRGLFDAFTDEASVDEAAARAGVDAGYLRRWAEAAFAFEYLEESGGRFRITELGRAFRPGAPGTLMPMAIQAVLGAHMMERAAGLMPSGERPGESVLAERETVLPWFGPMLEATFAPLFAREVLPKLDIYREVDARGGLVVDLGCGNGWYLRALADRYPAIRGLGLDGFAENARQAKARADERGFGDRLRFDEGDLFTFAHSEPVDVIAMNRALHHVWHDEPRVFRLIHDALRPGGAAVIWEPAWPDELGALRSPRFRPMAFQNVSEHVQGNHFLRPDEIEAAFARVGMRAETFRFAEGSEAVVVGRRV